MYDASDRGVCSCRHTNLKAIAEICFLPGRL